jgi:hypothetical protein
MAWINQAETCRSFSLACILVQEYGCVSYSHNGMHSINIKSLFLTGFHVMYRRMVKWRCSAIRWHLYYMNQLHLPVAYWAAKWENPIASPNFVAKRKSYDLSWIEPRPPSAGTEDCGTCCTHLFVVTAHHVARRETTAGWCDLLIPIRHMTTWGRTTECVRL